jgi:hypothetical protein
VQGNPAISYRDNENNLVKYAWSSTSTGSSSVDWTIEFVDGIPNGSGTHTSLAVVNGFPAIAYYDFGPQTLNYVVSTVANGLSGWTQHVVVGADSPEGEFCELLVIDGKPSIAYYNANKTALLYVRASTVDGLGGGSDWQDLVTVDNDGDTGQHCSLGIFDGRPVITYFDDSSDQLNIAEASTPGGGGVGDWDVTDLDSGVNSGQFTSLAEVDGKLAVAFYQPLGANLRYGIRY